LDLETYSLIQLTLIDGVGPARLGKLVDRFGSAARVLEAAAEMPEGRDGLPKGASGLIRSGDLEREAAAILEKCRRRGYGVTTVLDGSFPARLREDRGAPRVLYHIGPVERLSFSRAAAVVGTRNPDSYGSDMAVRFGRDLAAAGVVVVSGGAMGVDAAAHLGALSGGHGMTVSVLGSGLDLMGPDRNLPVFKRIVQEGGCLVSEFPPGVEAREFTFPRRNRTVASLSDGVVVVQGGPKSGALITAGYALDLGKKVWALMGNADSAMTSATIELKKKGAEVVASPSEVVSGLGLIPQTDTRTMEAARTDIEGDEKTIYGLLGGSPVHVDELTARSGLSAGRTGVVLLALELKGAARRLPGMLYLRGGQTR
jgi:DNA processing protein